MSTQTSDELRDFLRFVGEIVDNGGTSQSLEEILDHWRHLHPDPEVVEGDIAAIQEAIDDLENGDTGISFDEFDRAFRKQRNLPTKL